VTTDSKHRTPKIVTARMAYVWTGSIARCIPTDSSAAPEKELFQPLCGWEGPGSAGHCHSKCGHCSPSHLCPSVSWEQEVSFWLWALLFPTPCPLLPYHSRPPWRCPPKTQQPWQPRRLPDDGEAMGTHPEEPCWP